MERGDGKRTIFADITLEDNLGSRKTVSVDGAMFLSMLRQVDTATRALDTIRSGNSATAQMTATGIKTGESDHERKGGQERV